MVKIRLTRMGNKHRPFYRIVVSRVDTKRDGAAIEFLGSYDPLTKPSTIKLKNDRALYWLLQGAQPTETAARLLKREGVLDEFFAQRPKAKGKYKFLDKRTSTMSQESVIAAPVEAKAEAKAEAKVEDAPVAAEEAPATEAPATEIPAEETASE